jgi:hypothetical protein
VGAGFAAGEDNAIASRINAMTLRAVDFDEAFVGHESSTPVCYLLLAPIGC